MVRSESLRWNVRLNVCIERSGPGWQPVASLEKFGMAMRETKTGVGKIEVLFSNVLTRFVVVLESTP